MFYAAYGYLVDYLNSDSTSNRSIINNATILGLGVAYAGSFYDGILDSLRMYLDGESMGENYEVFYIILFRHHV